ncbi:hypothetical protein GCM10010518_20430 [Kitasatospora cinereorecta]
MLKLDDLRVGILSDVTDETVGISPGTHDRAFPVWACVVFRSGGGGTMRHIHAAVGNKRTAWLAMRVFLRLADGRGACGSGLFWDTGR